MDSEDNSNRGAGLESEDCFLSVGDEGREEGLDPLFSKGLLASSAMMAGGRIMWGERGKKR